MAYTINGIPSEEFETHVRREKIHKILEAAALQTAVKLREEGLLPSSGHAVCVSVFDEAHDDPDAYQFVKVAPEFTRETSNS